MHAEEGWGQCSQKFSTVAAAEEAYGICYFGEKESTCVGQTVPSSPFSVMSGAPSRSPLLGFSPLRHADVTKLPGCILDVIPSGFTKLTSRATRTTTSTPISTVDGK